MGAKMSTPTVRARSLSHFSPRDEAMPSRPGIMMPAHHHALAGGIGEGDEFRQRPWLRPGVGIEEPGAFPGAVGEQGTQPGVHAPGEAEVVAGLRDQNRPAGLRKDQLRHAHELRAGRRRRLGFSDASARLREGVDQHVEGVGAAVLADENPEFGSVGLGIERLEAGHRVFGRAEGDDHDRDLKIRRHGPHAKSFFWDSTNRQIRRRTRA